MGIKLTNKFKNQQKMPIKRQLTKRYSDITNMPVKRELTKRLSNNNISPDEIPKICNINSEDSFDSKIQKLDTKKPKRRISKTFLGIPITHKTITSKLPLKTYISKIRSNAEKTY